MHSILEWNEDDAVEIETKPNIDKQKHPNCIDESESLGQAAAAIRFSAILKCFIVLNAAAVNRRKRQDVIINLYAFHLRFCSIEKYVNYTRIRSSSNILHISTFVYAQIYIVR